MSRKATVSEIKKLLKERPNEIRGLLNEPLAQISLPIDDSGPRILARIPHALVAKATILQFTVDGENIDVAVELSDDYDIVHAQSRSLRFNPLMSYK
jgi:hypothetical protein